MDEATWEYLDRIATALEVIANHLEPQYLPRRWNPVTNTSWRVNPVTGERLED